MNYAVIGQNINYSLSPLIHLANFKSFSIEATYKIINISDIDKEIANLRQLSGFNITIPFKEEIINYCEWISNEAKFVRAVNCVNVIDNKLYGYNTDIYGFHQLLKINQINPNSQSILIIGAGGAAKAVYYCLQTYYRANIFVSNRTINKALEFTNNIIEHQDIKLEQFDVVINCTNVGVHAYNSPVEIKNIKARSTYIDLNYNNQSKFLIDANKLGAKTVDGLDMLIYQAAKSFEIWFHKDANIELIKQAIRKD